jgi:hypothetical protein
MKFLERKEKLDYLLEMIEKERFIFKHESFTLFLRNINNHTERIFCSHKIN